MEATEIDYLITRLEDMLSRLGIDWLVNRVNQQIAEGKLVSKYDIPTFKESTRGAVVQRVGKYAQSGKADFISTEAYTSREHILLLLDAVQAALDIALMQDQVVAFFQSQNDVQREVVISIIPVNVTRTVETEVSLSQISTDTSEPLLEVIQAIRREIDNVTN